MNYQIAAIPTMFRGRQYRSRLEARWAAFFDIAGWAAEYEPFDIGGWSPDFLLRNAGGCHWSTDVLVEVKPITSIDRDVCRKMETSYTHGFDHCLLLLGVAPWISKGFGHGDLALEGDVVLGWARTERIDPLDKCETSWLGVEPWFLGSGFGQPEIPKGLSVWDAACNEVQWHRS
jgi:hypothetical protein